MHRDPCNVESLNITRNMGVGGIISVEDYIKMERDSLKKYIENTIERLLNSVEGIQIK